MVGRRSMLVGILALCAACGGQGGASSDAGPYNVLLVSLDSVRHDVVGAYGGRSDRAPDVPTSPRIDALARDGVLFEEAYATTSWTLPSHVSMFAGVPEVVHGVDGDSQRPAADLPLLAEVLRDAGYRTAGFYSGPYLEPRFGFDRGFESYQACYGEELTAAAARLEDLRIQYAAAAAAEDRSLLTALASALAPAQRRLEQASHQDVSSAHVTDAALSELEAAAKDGRPFFLFTHYFDPHHDYVPPAPWDRAFDPDYPGQVRWSDYVRDPRVSIEDPEAESGRRRTISDRDLENVRASYAGEMRWVDGHVGRLLDRLDELGLADRTLVVVTSDHGDEFFEHGGIGHRRTLFEEVVRVPLVLRLPGELTAGERRSGAVSLADLAPTILDLVGVGEGSPRSLVAGTDDRGVVGRLVTHTPLRIHLPRNGGPRVAVAGQRVKIIESFRYGAIKVTRERSWVLAAAETDPDLAREVEARHGRATAVDDLSWIDVDAHRDEDPEHRSTDFSDRAARAALEAFHDRYLALLAERGRAERVSSDAGDLDPRLRGLGYTGDDEAAAVAADALVLPPPTLNGQ